MIIPLDVSVSSSVTLMPTRDYCAAFSDLLFGRAVWDLDERTSMNVPRLPGAYRITSCSLKALPLNVTDGEVMREKSFLCGGSPEDALMHILAGPMIDMLL